MPIVWHPNFVSLFCLAASWMVGVLAIFAWRHWTPGPNPVFLLLGNAIWLFAYGIATGYYDVEMRLLWVKFEFIGAGILIVGLITLTITYVGYSRWLTRRNLALISFIPCGGVLLAWTNEAHHLMWLDPLQLSIRAGASLLILQDGPARWVYLAFFYLAGAFAIFGFGKRFAQSRELQRKQAAILLGGTLFPLLGNVLTLSGLSPVPGLDLTLLGFTITALITAWGLMSNHLLGLGEIPRKQVVENIPDAIVILDMRDRIIDLNQAAIKYLGKPRELVLGYSLQRLVPSEVPRLRAYQHVWDTKEQIQLGSPDAPIFFTMSITPLYDWRKRLRGRMGILRDTSELQKRELALQEAKADLEMLNQRLVELMTSREIAQNQVLEQQRQLAIMNEREQLARDLHDNLGQVLGFFNMQAQASRKYLRDLDLNAIDAQLALIAEVALDSQLQLRDTIRELKSPVQTERRFFPSLALQIAKFEHDYGIQVIQEIDPLVSRRGFDATVSYQLLNILQEALNNIAKHAQASAVRLDILPSSSAANQATIIITDNGAGFLVTPPASALGHLGLGFMQERAQLAGGEIHIQSEPGQGTQLTIEMPLRELIQGETA